MTLTLQKLIEEADRKLKEAREAREKVIQYLQEEYDMEYEEYDYYRFFENECDWCYGIDEDEVEKFIKEKG